MSTPLKRKTVFLFMLMSIQCFYIDGLLTHAKPLAGDRKVGVIIHPLRANDLEYRKFTQFSLCEGKQV